MYFSVRALLSSLLVSGAIVLSSCDNDDDMTTPVKPDLVFVGLTASNQLITANANASGSFSSPVNITGLQTGESLLGIDFRPATGQLYGVGSTSRLYAINVVTGVATVIGTAPFTPAINGTLAGFDFNPTVDRIRLVTNTGQNLRLNPETGTVAAVDGNLNPGTPNISGAAYSNSFAGTATTVLFDIDLASQKLLKQDPPNNGSLVEVGSLGITATGGAGFDISFDNTVALATLTVGGISGLYSIDLTTGAAISLGDLSTPLVGIAIPTQPVAYTTDAANNLVIVNLTAGTTVTKQISGIATGENILGIDMRPATGQLYALGSTSIIYTINMSSGAATAVGTQFSTLLNGTSFGFDFNPTVDRIRVVSNTGQNLRVHPTLGGVAFVDGSLNPGTPAISAAAYSNNIPAASTTTLFDLDATRLYKQDPPNAGTLVEAGTLGVTADANNGFDIGGTSGTGYAILTVGGASKLYTINLTTGAATAVADMPSGSRSLAIGLGF